MSEESPKLDYLAPNISESLAQRGGAGIDPLKSTSQHQVARLVARRLLPACVVAPAVLWWVLHIGVYKHWYTMQSCYTLFVFSITVVFGLIVALNIRKLSRVDAQRAQIEGLLKRAKENAEAANRFKSAFFANISHEIRTPLTAINGFAELLLTPHRTDEERLSDARVIRRNGEHLLTLINDILDLSKIEAGRMSVERIACSPAAIVGEVCSMLRHRATEKGLTLDVAFEGPIPRTIRTDPTRLRQILINLVANAIKFTKEGGVRLTVWIKPTLRAENPQLVVKVADSGIGITPEQQASLFQPFVQGDATIARQYGGSGLGLAISRHFAVALEGDITLTSMPGHGSTFVVAVGTGSLLDAEVQDHPETVLASDDNFVGPKVQITGNVLVAEDGLDNQSLITAKLRETGLKIEIAPNGQIACEKALGAARVGSPFDLILMDVQMPVMDGFTATQELRGKGYKGPIIALTANAMERDRSKCLDAGCNDFVTKPIQMAALFKAIGRYLKVVQVTDSASAEDPAAVAAKRAALVQKFNEELPGEIEQIEEALEREDRVQLKDVAQLILGKASAADLKDVAVLAAKLFQAAENEKSWSALKQVVSEFARDSKPKPAREAA